MAYYKPCTNCATDKASCSRRAEVSKAIAGLSVTVVNFRCANRKSLFAQGQRVSFGWTSWESGDEYGEDYGVGLVYHGTVIQEHGLRFIVRVDDAPSADRNMISARDVFKSENLVIKIKPADMQALDEPSKELCPLCSAYEGEDRRCMGWGPVGSIDSFWPNGCMIQRKQSQASIAEIEAQEKAA